MVRSFIQEAQASVQVLSLETPELGDRSYLIHSGGEAVVIDPQRDIERALRAADDVGAKIRYVVETHVHNDYVSGGTALAKETAAAYLVPHESHIRTADGTLADDEEFGLRSFRVRALHTPGHTEHHTSYLAMEPDGTERAIFSGGSLLYGVVGRTDLVADDLTPGLTKAQYESARRLLALPAHTILYPTHGFGSFCAASQVSIGAGLSSTIAEQRRHNTAATDNPERFARDLMGGFGAYPRYYAYMSAHNRVGGSPAILPVIERNVRDLTARMRNGAWVVDIRPRRDYLAGHLHATVNAELSRSFTTYLGWVIPWDAQVTLIAPDSSALHHAAIDLSRIGRENVRLAEVNFGDVTPDNTGTSSSTASTTFANLKQQRPSGEAILDVRSPDEWSAAHIPGSHNVPIYELMDSIKYLPNGRLWVHCQSGYRAAIAMGLLEASGRQGVLIDDHFANAGAFSDLVSTPA